MGWEPHFSRDEVQAAVFEAISISGALRNLGLRPAGHNHRTFKKLVGYYGISLAHFDPKWALRRAPRRAATPLEEVLVEHSTYHRGHLKRRLYEAGLKLRSCELCGQGEDWHGAQMALILDHINGVATDNRLENLRIVCPNCNATLETHCGRRNRVEKEPRQCLWCGSEFIPRYRTHRYCSQACGVHRGGPRGPRPERRKVERPSDEQLQADLGSMSVCAVGRKYGVSDNAVRKWLRSHVAPAATEEGAAAGDDPLGRPRGGEPTRAP